MSPLDAIAIVSTGIVSSLISLSLEAAPALAQTENLISNVRQERTLPVENNSKYQPIVFTADISSDNVGNQMGDNGKTITLIAAGVGTAGLIWSLNRKNQTLSPAKNHHPQNDISIEQANPRLRQELLRLLGGDRQTANRLVAGIKQTHPEKSINWAVEKAIYDLERDR